MFGALSSAASELGSKVSGAVDTVTGQAGQLSETKVVAGLREALEVATKKAVDLVSIQDGYFANRDIKIPLPEELQSVNDVVSKLPGLSNLMDDFILTMNRAAEAAAKEAADIFLPVITGMTIENARNILTGDTHAATRYFETCTRTSLYARFMPIVEARMRDVGLIEIWDLIKTQTSKLPFFTLPSLSLGDFVTTKALDGLFKMLGVKEAEIRTTPAARVTPLLQEVFKHVDSK